MTMPRRIVVFTKSALDDLDQDIAYLEENAGEKVTLRYLHAIEETVQLLADFPDIGTHCSFQSLDSSSVRRKAVAGPFLHGCSSIASRKVKWRSPASCGMNESG